MVSKMKIINQIIFMSYAFIFIFIFNLNSGYCKTKKIGLSTCDTVFFYEIAINEESNFLGNRCSCDKDVVILFATNCLYPGVKCKLYSGKVKAKKKNYKESRLKFDIIARDEIPTEIGGKKGFRYRPREFYDKINEIKNNYDFFWIAELKMNCYHVFHEIRFKAKEFKYSTKHHDVPSSLSVYERIGDPPGKIEQPSQKNICNIEGRYDLASGATVFKYSDTRYDYIAATMIIKRISNTKYGYILVTKAKIANKNDGGLTPLGEFGILSYKNGSFASSRNNTFSFNGDKLKVTDKTYNAEKRLGRMYRLGEELF